jgi:hypothetical protein
MSALTMVLARGAVTTPARLVRAMAGITLAALLAAAVTLWAAGSIGDAARTIGRDAEPSVALALRMAATLADMDAAALEDSLIDGGAATGTSARFRADMAALAADIVEAARNITYGDAEAGPLKELIASVVRYEEAVATARMVASGGAWFTTRRVQWASVVARDIAIPAAEALAAANAAELEQRYAEYRASSLTLGGAAFAAFAVLFAVLLGVQAWLAARMRRLINPPLAAATVLTAACGLWLGISVLTERADLRAAKADAYDSLHVLFEAKAATAAMRAAASLWLLDPATRADAQAHIAAAAHALIETDLADPGAARALLTALRRVLTLEMDGAAAEALAQAPHPGGLLGTELDNITFGAAERDPATDSVARLVEAERVIRTVQAEALKGDHAQAVARWLDAKGNGGVAAFEALDDALDRLVAVNQSEFDIRVTQALGRAQLIPVVACVTLALVALLSAGGLWLRLREYR